MLLSCKDTKLVIVRAKLKDKMHTKIGIERTLDFLKDSRICTRKWHLERKQEEAEQEEQEAGSVDLWGDIDLWG